ncbi:MAG: DUF3859 domain-containing protein [Hyphomicrobiaceae bacterium]
MKILLASLFLIFAPCCVSAQTLTVQRVIIINPGIYEVETNKRIAGENLEDRSWDVVRKFRYVQAATAVPARLCISFGFEYVIIGAPKGAEIPIKMVTKFPEAGLYDPQTRRITRKNSTLVGRTIGTRFLRSYTFDKRWELVPGIWTFQLWHKDEKLAEQSFAVTASKETPSEGKCEESPVAATPASSEDELREAG